MRTQRNLDAYEARRLRAIRLFDSGLRQSEVAARMDVSRQAVSQWVHAWQRGGEAAVARVRHRGRPSKLTPRQQERLGAMLNRGASAYGYPNDRWSGRRVAELLRGRFGVVLHPNYAGQLLRAT